MSAPCGRCGGTPTRLYPAGRRCPECTPAALTGQPEPPEGYCAPHRHYCPPDQPCTTPAPDVHVSKESP